MFSHRECSKKLTIFITRTLSTGPSAGERYFCLLRKIYIYIYIIIVPNVCKLPSLDMQVLYSTEGAKTPCR